MKTIATFHVPNGNAFRSPQELANHLPLYDPPRIIAAFAWDLRKSKRENISPIKYAHTELFDKEPWTN